MFHSTACVALLTRCDLIASTPLALSIIGERSSHVRHASSEMDGSPIYKICSVTEWREAAATGIFRGSAVDHRDGFIHFSTAGQVAETARRHFAGQRDLVLVSVDAAALGERLRFEPSRGGALFPHLYGPLELAAVVRVEQLLLGADGGHVFPATVLPLASR
jgi:uncharacterized protein (DUF952 family)